MCVCTHTQGTGLALITVTYGVRGLPFPSTRCLLLAPTSRFNSSPPSFLPQHSPPFSLIILVSLSLSARLLLRRCRPPFMLFGTPPPQYQTLLNLSHRLLLAAVHASSSFLTQNEKMKRSLRRFTAFTLQPATV